MTMKFIYDRTSFNGKASTLPLTLQTLYLLKQTQIFCDSSIQQVIIETTDNKW